MPRPDPGSVHLSVVIPSFNEETGIFDAVTTIAAYLRTREYASELIVVDDGSRDRTSKRAAEALRGMERGRIIKLPKNRGKGAAVKEGIMKAEGDFILFSDADLSTPIQEIEKFWPLTARGCDVVIGSRALPGSDVQIRQAPFRELLGKTFNVFVRLLILDGIRDTQCGFKLFRREAARRVFPRVTVDGFSFDVEALDLFHREGTSIGQVPVIWRNAPESRVKIMRSSLRMLLDLLRIRFRRAKDIRGRRKA